MFLGVFGVFWLFLPLNDDLWSLWDVTYLAKYGLNVSHFLALLDSEVMPLSMMSPDRKHVNFIYLFIYLFAFIYDVFRHDLYVYLLKCSLVRCCGMSLKVVFLGWFSALLGVRFVGFWRCFWSIYLRHEA